MYPHPPVLFNGGQTPCSSGRFSGQSQQFPQRVCVPLGQHPGGVYRTSSVGGGRLTAQNSGQIQNKNNLPTLQENPMMPQGRRGVSVGGPMPPQPPASAMHYMRGSTAPSRPHPMTYASAYSRGISVHGPLGFQNNYTFSQASQVNGAHTPLMNGRSGGRGCAMVHNSQSRNLPILPPSSVVNGYQSQMPRVLGGPNYRNCMMPFPNITANNASVNSNIQGSSNVSNSNNSFQETYVNKEDVPKRVESETPPFPSMETQQSTFIKTPTYTASDEDSGLSTSPTILQRLNSYEEEEVKDFFPNVFFCGTESCEKIEGKHGLHQNDGFDDENYHYRVVVGDHLFYRYEVLKILGQGTFGIVVKAMDHKEMRLVAVKIIKNKPNYTKQAREEIGTLQHLNSSDANDEANIVRFLRSHTFRNHYIIVFELLPYDLYALIQANRFTSMRREFIYELAEQLLTALEHVEQCGIVHCDLKPENIMIEWRNPEENLTTSTDFRLKVIDFGSACEEKRPLFTYIQSRYYRAPEIVLGIPYTTAIDMWSFGCVICELANGYPIFPASCEAELLERVVEYFGEIPPYLIRQGRHADKLFDSNNRMKPRNGKRKPHPPHSRSLVGFLKLNRGEGDDHLFEDFISGCLDLDPKQRLTPAEALQHPWMEWWRYPSEASSNSSESN